MLKSNPLRWHFVVFLILSAVGIAQLSWWVIFQVQEGGRVTRLQEMIWSEQIKTAKAKLNLPDQDEKAFESWLTENFPDIDYPQDGNLVISAEAKKRLDKLAQKRVRMFVSEVAFFSLLVLAGIWYLYWALRQRVKIEQQILGLVNTTSFQLENPVASMKERLAEIARSAGLSPEQKHQLDEIDHSMQKISEIIDRLSMAELMEASKRRTDLRMIDLSLETSSVLEHLNDLLTSSGLRVDVKIERDLKTVANPERWRHIIRGLVENSLGGSEKDNSLVVRLYRFQNYIRLDIIRHSGKTKDLAETKGIIDGSGLTLKAVGPQLDYVGEMANMIGARISCFDIVSENGTILRAELPVLETD